MPDAIRAYFSELYWNRSAEFFDAVTLDEGRYPILLHLADAAPGNRFDFHSITRAFRVIDREEPVVIVPWRVGLGDRDAKTILNRSAAIGSNQANLRVLQRYAVPVPRRLHEEWLAQGVIRTAHPASGDALLQLHDAALYDATMGLRVFDPAHRTSTHNLL